MQVRRLPLAILSCHSSRIHWPDTHSGYLSRVREPVSRSKSGVQGKIADVFHGRSRHAESRNELQGFRVMDRRLLQAVRHDPHCINFHPAMREAASETWLEAKGGSSGTLPATTFGRL